MILVRVRLRRGWLETGSPCRGFWPRELGRALKHGTAKTWSDLLAAGRGPRRLYSHLREPQKPFCGLRLVPCQEEDEGSRWVCLFHARIA